MSQRRQSASQWVRFGALEVDLRTGELSRQGRRIRLADKPSQVLVALLERPGQLVTREELRRRLWSEDTFVDFDNNLNALVSRLREALNDSVQGPRFIETIPRKGYRFVGPPPVWDGSEPSPEDAPSSPRRWASIALAAGIVAAGIAAIYLVPSRDRGKEEPSPLPAERSMVAVLPFENLSEDPHQEYLADGLTEELLIRLGKVSPEGLGVIARTSVRRYKKTEKTIEEIGRELGVTFVVEGSVRVQGERLRITVQLIRVSDQTHMWSEAYDRDAGDLLQIQNDIALQVATSILPWLLALDPEVTGEGKTESAEAFREYLEGLSHLSKNNVEASRRAALNFERAVALDSDHAPSWAALAKARNFIWFGAATPEVAAQVSEQARAAATKALALDPALPEAYVALAFSRLYHLWDARGAAEALGPVLAGASNSLEAHQLASAALSALALHEEALGATAQALILDPGSPDQIATAGWYSLFADRPAEAEVRCRRAFELEPEALGATECLYQALLRNGKGPEAVRVLGRRLIREGMPEERFRNLDPEDPAKAIPEIEGIRLESIFAERADDPAAPFDAAAAFALRGEIDQALEGLARALEGRDSRLLYLGVDPRFDSLRERPRFQELLRRVSVPD